MMSRQSWYRRLALRLTVALVLVALGVWIITRLGLHGNLSLVVAGGVAAVVGLGLRGPWSFAEYQRRGRP